METTENQGGTSIDYDGIPIVEEQIDGTDYRIDAGRGAAVAISARETGTWSWQAVSEGRWDGVRLRAKGLGYPIVEQLGKALKRAAGELASGD